LKESAGDFKKVLYNLDYKYDNIIFGRRINMKKIATPQFFLLKYREICFIPFKNVALQQIL
jgi:hypothetical protein